jgi:hypothetical protein
MKRGRLGCRLGAVVLFLQSTSAFLSPRWQGPLAGSLTARQPSVGRAERTWRAKKPALAAARPGAGRRGVSALSAASGAQTKWEVSDRVRDFLQGVEGNPLQGLEAADRAWSFLRSDAFTTPPASPAVASLPGQAAPATGPQDVQCEVVVAGGTLGIFVAAALAVKGVKVAVLGMNVWASNIDHRVVCACQSLWFRV